ncbi:hypothetical protein JY651_09105 [Pyxidicoccus parkwayensis]|uniref:Lipoprotein n=1 Tax=Pyxidicoccus parkwayensis TaxID=2813578 RepID=A0ABX7P3P4_9BACT|nr:hypothetical protein [Pyxidicoccus parkwaysis]QSQ25068.1 hypothetical protein JY651_09105 [Pyxidicoccus parkwaysis]
MKKPYLMVALLALLGGCVTTPPSVGEAGPTLPDEQAEEAYQAVLAKYSGRDEIYDGFDTRLFAGATLQTPAFREARVRRQAAFQALPANTVEKMLADERAAAAKANEFFLGVHLNEYRYGYFDQKPPMWHIALVTPTGEVTPTRVLRLGRVDLDMRAYYPYTGVFWVGWKLEFPTTLSNGDPVIPPGTKQVLLRVASSLGKAEMVMAAE